MRSKINIIDFIISAFILVLITSAVYFEWPFETERMNVYFSGLAFVALIGTLVLQQRALQVQRKQFEEELKSQKDALELQRQQIESQWKEAQFGRIIELIQEPAKRYWEILSRANSMQRDTMTLLVSRHMTGLALGIEFLKEYDPQGERKQLLEYVYEPLFMKWALGNQDVFDDERKKHLTAINDYYGLTSAG